MHYPADDGGTPRTNRLLITHKPTTVNSRVEVEVVLVERAGDLKDALSAADDALG